MLRAIGRFFRRFGHAVAALRLVSLNLAARLIGMSRLTSETLIGTGALVPKMVAGIRFLRWHDVVNFLKRRTTWSR